MTIISQKSDTTTTTRAEEVTTIPIATAIPVATAIFAEEVATTRITTIPQSAAIPAATASVVHMIYLEILPHESSHISFVGIPPRVSQILQAPPALRGREAELTGAYFHSLKITTGTHNLADDLEISNITSDEQLRQILIHFQHLKRQIVLSNHAPRLNETSSCVYKHTLPYNVSLQVDFDGFPAKVKAVAPTSILYGRIQPGQYVDSVYVNGQEPLTPNVPGFTGYRVQQHLENTKIAPHRILVVSDPSTLRISQDYQKKRKGNTPLFDWGGFFK